RSESARRARGRSPGGARAGLLRRLRTGRAVERARQGALRPLQPSPGGGDLQGVRAGAARRVFEGPAARPDAAFDEGALVTAGRKPSFAVVDYQAGNLASVLKGLRAAGGDPFVTRDAADLGRAEAIVVPGVGHFGATRDIDVPLRGAIAAAIDRGRPVL